MAGNNYVGRRAEFGVAVEATRGVMEVPTHWVPYNSISFDDKATVVVTEEGFGNIQDAENSHVTKRYAEGEVTGSLYDKALGVFLAALFGQSPTSGAGPPYTHTYTLLDNNAHKSLSLFVQDPNGQTIFPLSMINSFTISVEPEGLVMYTINFRSASGEDWAVQSPVYTSLGEQFLAQHLNLKIEDDITALDASSDEVKVRSFEITFEKNLTDWDDLGSSTVTPGDILNQQFGVSGTIELAYIDREYRNYYLKDTSQAVEMLFLRDADHSLKMQFPLVQFQTWEPNKGLDDIATQTFEFKAMYDSANEQDMVHLCELINQDAGTNYA